MGLREILADTRPLRTPAFRRLWTANIVTVVGAQLTVVAVPAQIYSITGSSGWVGLTGLFGLVPLVVFDCGAGPGRPLRRAPILLVTTTGLIATSGLFWLQAALALKARVLLGLFAAQAFFAVNQPTRTTVAASCRTRSWLRRTLNMTVMQAGDRRTSGRWALMPVTGFAWLYFIDTITCSQRCGRFDSAAPPRRGRLGRAPGLRAVWDGLLYLRAPGAHGGDAR